MNNLFSRFFAKSTKTEVEDDSPTEGIKGYPGWIDDDEGKPPKERNTMKEAMITARREHFTDPGQLEALGFDPDISRNTISILKELEMI